MFKVAFIGGGINSAIGRTHKIACQMDGKFKVVAGAFSRDDRINRETAKEFDIADDRVYMDYSELIDKERERIDAIVVLTPTDTHLEIVRQCIEAGYPVICEKSLTTCLELGKAVFDLVEKKKAFLCVTYNYTGYPMVRVLREKIKQGRLGKITNIAIEMPQEGFTRYTLEGKKPVPQSWRLKDYTIPTISLDLGTHLHNMIAFLTEAIPLRVVAREKTYGFFENIIDNVECLIDYSDDISVQMWYSKVAIGNRNGLRIRIYGTKASAEWYQMEPEVLQLNDCYGSIQILDRSNDLEIGMEPRYNRFKPGHPIGFIEAFANYYSDIYDLLLLYKQGENLNSKYILPLEYSVEGLALFEAAHHASQHRMWREVGCQRG